eukprot:1710042-Heterocapsa_arctica.AAC.1
MAMSAAAIITRQQRGTLWMLATAHAAHHALRAQSAEEDICSFVERIFSQCQGSPIDGIFQVALRQAEHAARFSASRTSMEHTAAGHIRRGIQGNDFIAVDSMSIDSLAAAGMVGTLRSLSELGGRASMVICSRCGAGHPQCVCALATSTPPSSMSIRSCR